MILQYYCRSAGGMGSSSQLGVGGGGGAVGGAIGGSAGQQLASTNPRGYSSFTESDQDGSSAVVSLNGTQVWDTSSKLLNLHFYTLHTRSDWATARRLFSFKNTASY